MSPQSTSAIAAYLRATANETAADAYLVTETGCQAWLPAGIPRPLKIAAALGPWGRNTRWLFPVLVVLWPLCFLGLQCGQAAVTLFQLLRSRPYKPALPAQVAIASSLRINDKLAHVPADQQPAMLICLPWCQVDLSSSTRPSISLLQRMRISDVWWALYMSVRGAIAYAFHADAAVHRLQTYTAFRWFLTWRVLARETTVEAIWFGNHYDRWAVLLDSLPSSAERILVQHGFARRELNLPVRLEHVSRFYYFDEATKQILLDMTLPDEATLQLHKLRPQLKLTPIDRQRNEKHLLLISQPIDSKKESALIAALAARLPEVQVWFKPHPLYSAKASQDFAQSNVRVIKDPSFFPDVDVALSGQSWLGVEYEGSGTAVVWHWQKSVENTLQEITDVLARPLPSSPLLESA